MSSPPSSPVAGTAFFNPFPKYLQVRQALERRLYAGFELGQQLPTEKALCEEFGVSRETVREALRGLEDDGIIQRHRAKGTFFVRRPEQLADQKLTGLVEDYAALKLDTHAKVLEAAPLRAAPQLPLVQSADAPQFRIRRLRYLDGRPLVLHEAFLPTLLGERVAALDLTHASISHLLEKQLRIRFVEERHQIEAIVADTELAQLLDIAVGAPVLLTTRVLRLQRDAAMVLFKSYYRADRYYYTLSLAKPPPAEAAASRRKKVAT
ncbi:MAG TPA: GntR family transcriptional regulator [Burkholderiaceae bacterium]|jgi:GntR family transcriptional regulator